MVFFRKDCYTREDVKHFKQQIEADCASLYQRMMLATFSFTYLVSDVISYVHVQNGAIQIATKMVAWGRNS